MNDFFNIENDFDEVIEEESVLNNKKIKVKNSGSSITLFNHLKKITEEEYDKYYFKNLSESGKKTFTPYMITRYLSMNKNWLSIVNFFQKYNQILPNESIYKFYSNVIPKGKIYLKYVTGSKVEKYNSELIGMVGNMYEASIKESIEYIDLLFYIGKKSELERICKLYGKTDDEIKKILK